MERWAIWLTFAEIIERASYGTDLHPGDIIEAVHVGTVCFLELNGTQLKDPGTGTMAQDRRSG
jgi:hypothetical protein